MGGGLVQAAGPCLHARPLSEPKVPLCLCRRPQLRVLRWVRQLATDQLVLQALEEVGGWVGVWVCGGGGLGRAGGGQVGGRWRAVVGQRHPPVQLEKRPCWWCCTQPRSPAPPHLPAAPAAPQASGLLPVLPHMSDTQPCGRALPWSLQAGAVAFVVEALRQPAKQVGWGRVDVKQGWPGAAGVKHQQRSPKAL